MSSIPSVVELTSTLINFPSLSGQETEVINYLKVFFESHSWPTYLLELDDGTANLYVGSKNSPIILTTHLDVVPVSSDTQFSAVIKEQRLFGRGACDAKGVAAAMISAACKDRDVNHNDVGLLFVVGEEYDGRGAKAALHFLKSLSPRAIINGEPTENILCSAQKGALDFQIKILGSSAHSGYPHLGVDANKILYELMKDLYATTWEAGAEMYGEALLNIGYISGGSASNIVSEEAMMRALIRSGASVQSLKDQVIRVVGSRATTTFSYECDPLTFTVPSGYESCVVSFVSDAAFYAALDTQVLQGGPGSIHQAHTKDEFIEIDQLEKGILFYQSLIENFRN